MKYYAIITEESLSHHGIKGQKWGDRKVPWYPISAYEEHLRKQGYSKDEIKKSLDSKKYQKHYKKELKKRLWSVSSNVQTNKIFADEAKKTSNMHPNDKMLKLISDIIENDLNKSIDEYELIAKEWVNKYGEKYINNGTKLFGLAENAIGEANRLSKERISEHNSASKVPNEYKKTSEMPSISIPEHNSALKINDSVKKNAERVIEKSGTPENKAYKERLKEYKYWNPGKYSDEQLKKMAKADASEETASYIQYLQDCGLSAQKIHEKHGYSIDTIRSAISW